MPHVTDMPTGIAEGNNTFSDLFRSIVLDWIVLLYCCIVLLGGLFVARCVIYIVLFTCFSHNCCQTRRERCCQIPAVMFTGGKIGKAKRKEPGREEEEPTQKIHPSAERARILKMLS